jgi:hypothetical protein
MNTVFWLENLKRRDNLEDLDVDGWIILDWIRPEDGGSMNLCLKPQYCNM